MDALGDCLDWPTQRKRLQDIAQYQVILMARFDLYDLENLRKLWN